MALNRRRRSARSSEVTEGVVAGNAKIAKRFTDPQYGDPGYEDWLAGLPARWASHELPYGWGEWDEGWDPKTMVSSRNTEVGPYVPEEGLSRQMRRDLARKLGQQPRGFYYAKDDTGRLRRYTEEGAEPEWQRAPVGSGEFDRPELPKGVKPWMPVIYDRGSESDPEEMRRRWEEKYGEESLGPGGRKIEWKPPSEFEEEVKRKREEEEKKRQEKAALYPQEDVVDARGNVVKWGEYEPGEILLSMGGSGRFNGWRGPEMTELNRRFGATPMPGIRIPETYHLRLAPGTSINEALQAYRSIPGIGHAGVNRMVFSDDTTGPSDGMWSRRGGWADLPGQSAVNIDPGDLQMPERRERAPRRAQSSEAIGNMTGPVSGRTTTARAASTASLDAQKRTTGPNTLGTVQNAASKFSEAELRIGANNEEYARNVLNLTSEMARAALRLKQRTKARG